MNGPVRPWLFKGGLLLATTLLSLLFAECAVRLIAPQELSVWAGKRSGLFVLQPGIRAHSARWGHEIAVNSLGFRGPEPAEPADPDRTRILVLGDSFIEAAQVAWPDSMSSRLAAELAAEGRAVEVLSAGVSGWGTDDVVEYLSTEGMALEPDVLIVVVTIYNDVLDNLGEEFHRLKDGRLQAHDDSRMTWADHLSLRIKSYWSSHFHLYQLVRRASGRAATGDAFANLQSHWVDLLKRRPEPAIEYGYALSEALLDEADQLATRSGARLVVVLIPMREQLSAARAEAFLAAHGVDPGEIDLEAPQKRFTAWGAERGVVVVDLLEAFREVERSGGGATYVEGDGHWNERGHAIAGQVVADALIEQGQLAPSPSPRPR